MRFVAYAQRFVNVFAAMQSRAVVVVSNATGYLLHLLHALLGTWNTLPGKSPGKRDSIREGWSIRSNEIRYCESRSFAYATVRRDHATRRDGC